MGYRDLELMRDHLEAPRRSTPARGDLQLSDDSSNDRKRWAYFRFSIIGGLLAQPPETGQLRAALSALAHKTYVHPDETGDVVTFGLSTIERWYYLARNATDPITALSRKVRADAGKARVVMSSGLLSELEQQYRAHRRWTYQLHYDNLAALVKERPELGRLPSYPTVRRRMVSRGWIRQPRAPRRPTAGQQKALNRLEKREVRSYEATHVGGLWHSDFHEGSLAVVNAQGEWHKPWCFGVLDDNSRLCCHIQWYLIENAENFFHGHHQAFAKRGLPRAEMTDRGGAQLARESRNGLKQLGIDHQPTLSYSPYQNGKQESFWDTMEGRLLPMLERVGPLTLDFLNRASLAWADLEYNRRHHDEIGTTPLARFLAGPDVSRPAPNSAAMRFAFSRCERRTQRKSDGTVSIKGVRFEVPSRLRVLRKLWVRYQSWDLSSADIVDERDRDQLLARIRPVDKHKNADGRRRSLSKLGDTTTDGTPFADADPLPPLMRKLLADYAATGLPPAYLPKDEIQGEDP